MKSAMPRKSRASLALLCPSDAVPVRVLTDGERFANHPAPDAAPISAARQSGDVLESQLPQLRAMAMLLAAQRWREQVAQRRRGWPTRRTGWRRVSCCWGSAMCW